MKDEIETIKRSVLSLSHEASVYLFGSRLDDQKVGGDIDLLVVSEKLTRRDLRKIRLDFYEKFGEQKIDILLDDGSFSTTFNRMAKQMAVQL